MARYKASHDRKAEEQALIQSIKTMGHKLLTSLGIDTLATHRVALQIDHDGATDETIKDGIGHPAGCMAVHRPQIETRMRIVWH